MQKKEGAIAGSILIAALVLSFCFDRQISVFFESLRGFYLNHLFIGVKFLDTEIIVAGFLTLVLVWKAKRREWILPLWLSFLATGIASFLLKYLIKRQRPFAQGVVALLSGIADKASYHVWDFSFPSFDTALAFCGLPLMWKFFPKFRYMWLAFSILVGLSRIYFGVHFMSDVIFGAIIGLGIGAWIIKMENKSGRLRKLYHRVFK